MTTPRFTAPTLETAADPPLRYWYITTFWDVYTIVAHEQSTAVQLLLDSDPMLDRYFIDKVTEGDLYEGSEGPHIVEIQEHTS